MRTNHKISEISIRKAANLLIFLILFLAYLLATESLFATPSIVLSMRSDSSSDSLATVTVVDTIVIEDESAGDPFMGVVLRRDLSFDQAQALQYPHSYGAYVDRVVEDSPADRAGIIEDDIITNFGGEKVLYNDHLVRLVGRHQVGDSVEVVLFRDGKTMKANLVLEPEEKVTHIVHIEEPDFDDEPIYVETRKSPVFTGDIGDGYFAWKPSWYMPDAKDLYQFLESLGYPPILTEHQINDQRHESIYMSGFHLEPGEQNGALHWGIDWSKGTSRQNAVFTIGAKEVSRRLDFTISYWGLSLEGKIPLFDRILIAPALTGGRARMCMSFYQPNPSIDWDDLNQRLNGTDEYYLEMEKKYWIIQPNINVTLRIADNLGILASVGYFYGFPQYDGWRLSSEDSENWVSNSPNSSIGGFIFSVGPSIIFD